MKKTPSTLYWSTEGLINPSPEREKLLAEAQLYAEICSKNGYECWLIYSGHWASEGYWVEFKKVKLGTYDHIIRHYLPQTVRPMKLEELSRMITGREPKK